MGRKPKNIDPQSADAQEAEQAQQQEQEEKLWEAAAVQEIAQKMIQSNSFGFPTNTPVAYIFKKKMSDKWGLCQKASALIKMLTGYEFIIIMNHDAWQGLSDLQREALTYHELKHIGYDSGTDKYSIVKHDLEEFASVVKRYGMWRESVSQFTTVAMEKIHDTGEAAQ